MDRCPNCPALMCWLLPTLVGGIAVGAPSHSNVPLLDQGNSPQCLVDTNEHELVRAADLAGTFDIALHVTEGREHDSLVAGRITLVTPTDSIRREVRPYVEATELYGWTTLSTERIGEITVTVPLSSSDPILPGVLGYQDPIDTVMVLELGATAEHWHLAYYAGLRLKILHGDIDQFRGTWLVETLRRPRPSGYFCARRVQDMKP